MNKAYTYYSIYTFELRIIERNTNSGRERKDGMTIEYLKCRACFNFEIEFRVNGTIARIATQVGSYIIRKMDRFIYNIVIFFQNPTNMPLNYNLATISGLVISFFLWVR